MAQQSGLFAQTRSFAAPGPASRRLAVIDVGSNSVRLVVFDGHARSPAYFFNEKVQCGLGDGMVEGGPLNPEGRRRALATLRRFAALAERQNVNALVAVATAAVRMATDGAEFVAQIEAETGLRVRIASGEDEARLAGQGVLLGDPTASGVVVDVGGSSMELARIARGRCEIGATTLLGPLALRNSGLTGRALAKEIDARLAPAIERIGRDVGTLYLVGGAWRAMGRAHMHRSQYPLSVLNDYNIATPSLAALSDWVQRQSMADLVAEARISSDRAALLGLNAQVLSALIAQLRPGKVVLSAYGLREGLLWELMSPRMRARDPLIEACRYLEARRARFPGFGAELFAWARPVLDLGDEATLRLARAACLLHDVNWRSHPDYRAQMGFETPIRAAIGSIDHRGRVLIGLALHHRYRSSGTGKLPRALVELLSAEDLVLAERLGRAMRLGAMIAGAAPGGLDLAPLSITGSELTLTLSREMRDLAGEVVDKRLAALARSLNLSPMLHLER